MPSRDIVIGRSARPFRFSVDELGWLRAVAQPDGSVPVIGGQFGVDDPGGVPEGWSPVHEATGNNVTIADGEDFYPGAEFDDTLVEGQVADVLWALGPVARLGQGRLLELGCGPGFLLAALRRALPGWSFVGIDPSPASVEQARYRGLDVSEGFLGTVEVEGPFDAVVVMGNLQLHPDPAETLRQLAELAGEGAALYFDVKNPRSTPRRVARRLLSTPVVRNVRLVHGLGAHAFHGMRHGIPKAAVPELLDRTGWQLSSVRTVAPRLLRFSNRHSFSRGPTGLAWGALDRIDGVLDERAWIQVAAVRR